MFGQVSNNYAFVRIDSILVKGEFSEIWTIEKQNLCDFKLSFFFARSDFKY